MGEKYCIIGCILCVLMPTILVSGQSEPIGNIVVHVKDQNGDNVHDPSGCIGGCWDLSESVAVELYHKDDETLTRYFETGAMALLLLCIPL